MAATTDYTLAMRLYADASRMVQGLRTGEGGLKRFTNTAKAEFGAVKRMITSVEGKLASLGITVGAVATSIKSAQLDKSLTQIGLTAGVSEAKVAGLRKELFAMAEKTGQDVDDLKRGFDNAVQAGLEFDTALPVLKATNTAMAVTGANADMLTSSLTVAGTAFGFDLTQPKRALTMLDQMTVAGRLGNAELKNLSDIISRVAPNAASAGFDFTQFLAITEGLSQVEKQPERLATLADSTIRLFTNLRYMKGVKDATGVKFFNADGSRKDALDVIAEIKQQYDKLDNDAKRAVFMQKAFGKADLDTIKGMRILLSGDMLHAVRQFSSEIKGASGTLEKDLDRGINNSIDQVGRLKASLRHAADDFAQPINDTISDVIKKLLDSKDKGGLELSGKEILGYGAGGTAATLLAARYGGKFLKKFGGVGAGVATGKALEQAAGVTPVYVVNMPAAGFGGLPGKGKAGRLGKLAKYAPAASRFGVQGLVGGTVLASGYGYGSAIKRGIDHVDAKYDTGISDAIGRQVAILLAPFSQNARDALRNEYRAKKAELAGKLDITLHDNRAPTVKGSTNQPGVQLNMANGLSMVSL